MKRVLLIAVAACVMAMMSLSPVNAEPPSKKDGDDRGRFEKHDDRKDHDRDGHHKRRDGRGDHDKNGHHERRDGRDHDKRDHHEKDHHGKRDHDKRDRDKCDRDKCDRDKCDRDKCDRDKCDHDKCHHDRGHHDKRDHDKCGRCGKSHDKHGCHKSGGYTEQGLRTFMVIWRESAVKGIENATIRAFNSVGADKDDK